MKFGNLFSWVFVVIKFIRRCICGRKKLKAEDENVKLPGTVLSQHASERPQTEDLTSWDDWGQNDAGLVSVKVESSKPAEDLLNQEQNKDDIDLFGDMQPVFQKPKKILLKGRALQTSNSHQASDRLKFDSSVGLPETELGTWTEEANAWNEISDHEIEWETQNVLKEKRLAEREKRFLEQQRKKEEREALRATKKTVGNLGVKIS